MAVDTLAAVSWGVLRSGTTQAEINSLFGSWGLLETAPSSSGSGSIWRVVGSMFRGLVNAMRIT